MGDTLSQPKKEKTTTSGQNDELKWAASEMQGWRRGMEDAHTTELDIGGNAGTHYFAVYDGHCGEDVAKYCGEKLWKALYASKDFKDGNYDVALQKTFMLMDEQLKEETGELKGTRAGCTAVGVLFLPDGRAICANAGDSRAVLSRGSKAVPLSEDHKPTLKTERERIEAAGGFVMLGRVNGNLALSRAIGDFEFKGNSELPPEEQAVIALPDITTEQYQGADNQFAVIACDGIWDVMSNQEVVDFVVERRKDNVGLDSICEQMMENCLATEPGGVGCDNMTVTIIEFASAKYA